MSSLLDTVIARQARDLQLEVGKPPTIRVKGILKPIGSTRLTAKDTLRLMDQITGGAERKRLDSQGCAEFGFAYGDKGRFWTTVFKQGKRLGLILYHLHPAIFPDPAHPAPCPVCRAKPRKK